MKAKHLLLSLSLCAVFSISFAGIKTNLPNKYQLGTCVATGEQGPNSGVYYYYWGYAYCYIGTKWVVKQTPPPTQPHWHANTSSAPSVDCDNQGKYPAELPSQDLRAKACTTAKHMCKANGEWFITNMQGSGGVFSSNC
jgi:hypothetical protein